MKIKINKYFSLMLGWAASDNCALCGCFVGLVLLVDSIF